MKFSNLIFWNGLDYKKMKHKVLLFIVFVEADVDILMTKSLRKERKVFLRTFEVFLSQCGHNWCKNLKFQNTFRSTLKWTFPFEVYTKKKFINNSVNVRGSRTGLFQEFLRTSRTGLFALSQNILKIIFIENYFKLIIWNINIQTQGLLKSRTRRMLPFKTLQTFFLTNINK